MICKHILIPFLIVILSALLFFHELRLADILVRPMILVYYAFMIGLFLSLYYILFGDK